MNMTLDIRRHLNLFDPYKFGETPVHVIGAGATGSWLVLQLAKLGITNITVWDFDVVEEHNVPNQLFGISDVGKQKVDALYEHVLIQTGLEIKRKNTRFTTQRVSGYVFLMVDTMSARKEIWEQAIKFKTAIKHLVEPRMGLDEMRIYNVNPMDMEQIKGYEACWYPDEEAEVSACGTSQTVITTALTCASMCVRQLINHFNERELDNEILVDLVFNGIYAYKWKEKVVKVPVDGTNKGELPF